MTFDVCYLALSTVIGIFIKLVVNSVENSSSGSRFSCFIWSRDSSKKFTAKHVQVITLDTQYIYTHKIMICIIIRIHDIHISLLLSSANEAAARAIDECLDPLKEVFEVLVENFE